MQSREGLFDSSVTRP
nr:unnamed protein product [Callosobruchus chinensis]